ncbi:MAG: pilin [Patescibacteria group bacterium]
MISSTVLKVLKRGAMLAAVGVFIGVPFLVFAADANLTSVASTSGLGTDSLMTIIGRVINVVLSLLGVIFLILLVYAGAIWMTAGGDGKKVDKAKGILINAVVGLLITMSAYAISVFVINLLSDATGGNGPGSSSGGPVVETLSNSLGSGVIRDHYPARGATDVSRNTRMFVTFRDTMDISSFITGYSTNGTPEDVSDDTAATAINSTNVKIYVRANGDSTALTDVAVYFTEDLKTFVFDPTEYLGSSTEDITYAVYLSDAIKNTDGDTPIDSGGYLWYFTTGTTIDISPPTVQYVMPTDGTTKDRNIVVQAIFSEAIDPTSSTGTRLADSGFSNIQIIGTSSTAPVAGEYVVSNSYKTITFTSTDACGTNSCGETIYCLPGGESITSTIYSATPTSTTDPTASIFPYDGIVDTSGNSLDGNSDGSVGTDDDYVWGFTTTNDINLDAPAIESITPNIEEENVALDQSIQITFDSIIDSSTASSSNIQTLNKEMSSTTSHEMWYSFGVTSLTAEGDAVLVDSQVPAKSLVTISHGTFLASDPTVPLSYMYSVTANQGVRNEYQNCFVPGEGPDAIGGTCGTTTAVPYCCNGVAQTTACALF